MVWSFLEPKWQVSFKDYLCWIFWEWSTINSWGYCLFYINCIKSCSKKSWIKILHNEWTYKMQFPSKCLICDKSFSPKCKSKKLVDSVHKYEDSHNCRICDKSFSHQCDLKNMLKKFMGLEQPHKRVKLQ